MDEKNLTNENPFNLSRKDKEINTVKINYKDNKESQNNLEPFKKDLNTIKINNNINNIQNNNKDQHSIINNSLFTYFKKVDLNDNNKISENSNFISTDTSNTNKKHNKIIEGINNPVKNIKLKEQNKSHCSSQSTSKAYVKNIFSGIIFLNF